LLRNYMPTFVSTCKKLAVYIAEHEHKMLDALENADFVSAEEKQQIRELFKQLKDMSALFHRLDDKF
jgi:hypothetical protein